jgi:hypothetical protein
MNRNSRHAQSRAGSPTSPINDRGANYFSTGAESEQRKKKNQKERTEEGDACGNCRSRGNRVRWPSAPFFLMISSAAWKTLLGLPQLPQARLRRLTLKPLTKGWVPFARSRWALFTLSKATSIENPKVLQKLKGILRKIEKFCGTFGFSAEDLDFLQKIGNSCGKTPRRDSRQRLIRSRNRILIVLLGPLCGPNDRLDIKVFIYAEDHALVDLGHRAQENAAIIFHLGPHF